MREHQTSTQAGHSKVADVFKGSVVCEARDSSSSPSSLFGWYLVEWAIALHGMYESAMFLVSKE